MHNNKEDSIVHRCALHQCRGTLNCSKRKQVEQLISVSILAVCKPTRCISAEQSFKGMVWNNQAQSTPMSCFFVDCEYKHATLRHGSPSEHESSWKGGLGHSSCMLGHNTDEIWNLQSNCMNDKAAEEAPFILKALTHKRNISKKITQSSFYSHIYFHPLRTNR